MWFWARGWTRSPIAIRFRRCGSLRWIFPPRSNGSGRCWPRRGIALPANLTFVPLDFEHKTLAEGLAEAGFDAGAPAFFGWLGVVPYLTLDAFRADAWRPSAQLPAGTGVSFDYAFPPETLSPKRRRSSTR